MNTPPANKLLFRIHALQRMFQRGISVDDVRSALSSAEVIEEYPQDLPYPSCLMIGWCRGRPLHIVVAREQKAAETIVIPVYEPDPALGQADFKRKKP